MGFCVQGVGFWMLIGKMVRKEVVEEIDRLACGWAW